MAAQRTKSSRGGAGSRRAPAKSGSKPRVGAKAGRGASRPAAPPPIRTPVAKRAARLKVSFRARGGASTEVVIGAGVIPTAGDGLLRSGGSVLVVLDAGLPRSLVEPLLRGLDRAGVRWDVCVVTATEEHKTLATLEDVLAHAARGRMERGDLMIAVGGGIVCDVAGLAAGLYRRGIRHVLCPTTLLAMVDASVGGKTAVNIRATREARGALLKNMVGVFHQPSRVVCDVSALRTLGARAMSAGMAECVKHGLIGGGCGDPKLLGWLGARAERVMARDEDVCAELVARNVKLKARVVTADEREVSVKPGGGRMMLNLGHTFAHAIETLPGLSWKPAGDRTDADHLAAVTLGPLLHGEAVGLGLVCAASLSERLGLIGRGFVEEVRGLLTRMGLPTRVDGLPPSEQIVERMMDDKKTAGGKLRIIAPVKGLRVRVVDAPPKDAVLAAINAVRV